MTTTSIAPAGKGWNIALWIAQILLAVAFAGAGFNHAFGVIDEMAKQMHWVASAPVALIRFIGAAELLGALGLLLPSITRIKPWLTPLAALGLATIQVLAMCLHTYLGEYQVLPVNLILLALALFIAWGRTKKAPIAAKS